MKFKLDESRKQNTYRIKYLDYDDNYNFVTIDAFSAKQAEYKLRHVYKQKGIARILSTECIEDNSDGEQLSLFDDRLNEDWYCYPTPTRNYYSYSGSLSGAKKELDSYLSTSLPLAAITNPHTLPNPLTYRDIVVTDSHRSLRNQTHNLLDASFNTIKSSPLPSDSLLKVEGPHTRFLFHHLNGREWDNNLTNILAIPYNDKMDLYLANFSHWALHSMYPITSPASIDVYEWDPVLSDWSLHHLNINYI